MDECGLPLGEQLLARWLGHGSRRRAMGGYRLTACEIRIHQSSNPAEIATNSPLATHEGQQD